MSMLDQFHKFVQTNNLFSKDSRVLLAISGGIDSMAMANLFLNSGMKPGIAHCNFQLRGKESDLDEEFVRNMAGQNNLAFYSTRFKTKEYAAGRKISVQMAARQLRYEWFENIRRENQYDKIATAHNLNDSIETMLINLTRGTGLTGLTGMKPFTGLVIRPLLFATRQQINEYSDQNGIVYREDRSNAETRYTRNKIRHLVIPTLKEINPSLEETLDETAKRLSALDRIITYHVNHLIQTTSVKDGDTLKFSVNKLTDPGLDKSLVFEVFSRYGVTGPLSADLFRLLQKDKTGKQIYTGTHRVLRNREELLIIPLTSPEPTITSVSEIDDLMKIPGIESVSIVENDPDFKIPDDRNIACIDLAELSFPLVVRGWRKGDYFYPLGLRNRKKLSDYFIDRKFSRAEKENVRILVSDDRIVWLLGERLDNRFRIKESTTRILLVRVLPCQSSGGQPGQ